MKPWIQTFTGKQFWPLTPKAEDVCIEDIAHALAFKCRFGGHCKTFYSVAEHSCRVAEILRPEHQLIGLLHDAAEAYLPDVAAPIKSAIGVKTREAWLDVPTSQNQHDDRFDVWSSVNGNTLYCDSGLDHFSTHEESVLWEILVAFGISTVPCVNGELVMPRSVKQADLILLATEARDLMAPPPDPWDLDVPVLTDVIQPLPPTEAEKLFLHRFHSLTAGKFGKQDPPPSEELVNAMLAVE